MREASPSRLINSAARELFHPRGFFHRRLDLDLRTLDLGQASRTGLCQNPLIILIDREVLHRVRVIELRRTCQGIVPDCVGLAGVVCKSGGRIA